MNGTDSDQIDDLKVFPFDMVSMPSLPKEKAGTICRREDEIYYSLCKKKPHPSEMAKTVLTEDEVIKTQQVKRHENQHQPKPIWGRT